MSATIYPFSMMGKHTSRRQLRLPFPPPDGGTCVGFILSRGVAGYEAFTADQQSLGVFKSEPEAAHKLWRHVHAQGGGAP
jgi:hypothetical protein